MVMAISAVIAAVGGTMPMSGASSASTSKRTGEARGTSGAGLKWPDGGQESGPPWATPFCFLIRNLDRRRAAFFIFRCNFERRPPFGPFGTQSLYTRPPLLSFARRGVRVGLATESRCCRSWPANLIRLTANQVQSSQKDLNRSGDSSVYRAVCWMFLCPRYSCTERVSCPSLASL